MALNPNPGVATRGASLHPPHGATHTYMGGTLATPTSPNDPVFTGIHTQVDRLWASYQKNNKVNGNAIWFADTGKDGNAAAGKMKMDEVLSFAGKADGPTIRDTLDYQKQYGYEYEENCS